MASLTFDETLFPDHPYGRPEDGYPETVQAITREDILDFHQRHYGPAEMVVVVVGAIAPEQAVEQVQAPWETGSTPCS